MNPVWGHLIGVVIVLLMMAFIGIWVWAWLPRHAMIFDRLAQIPMQDPAAADDLPSSAEPRDETR